MELTRKRQNPICPRRGDSSAQRAEVAVLDFDAAQVKLNGDLTGLKPCVFVHGIPRKPAFPQVPTLTP